MKVTFSKVALGAAALAAAVLMGPVSGPATGVVAASAAGLGPQTAVEAESSAVIPVKKGPGDFKSGGKGPGPDGPDGFKGGGKGGGGKGGGGKGHHHHHHHHGIGIGGVIIGIGYCAIQSERCEEAYGEHTYRYRRCMRRAGC
jgi:hypothetical protein